jgi:hypothetical protein
MIEKDITNIRLLKQQISYTKFKKVKDIVNFIGAIQAQDYAMAKWGIGIRLPGSTDKIVTSAINNGEIIRTHLLRPTWHFVSADDIYWMLQLTAPQIKSSMKSRNKELGLTEGVFNKSNRAIIRALSGRKNLTREELKKELEKAKINTDNNRLSHLLMEAELDGIICSGKVMGKKQTYAMLSERAPNKKVLTKEEALAELANRYFSSHGPATLKDFVWWSSLPVKDAKSALELIKSNFIPETFNLETYWMTNSSSVSCTAQSSIHLLPAYDEFIISYKSRAIAFASEHLKKAVSSNGIFRPVVLINGKVGGLWRRTINKNKVIIEMELFQQPSKKTLSLIKKKGILFGDFLGMKTELFFSN